MDILALFAYFALFLQLIWHPLPQLPVPPKPDQGHTSEPLATVFFNNENFSVGRLLYQGSTARSIYEHLDDSLIQRVELLADGRQLQVKASEAISCYQFQGIEDSTSTYQCVLFIDRQGRATGGYQGALLQTGTVETETEEQDILLLFQGEAAAAVFDHLEVLAYQPEDRKQAEVRKRGLNLVCAERNADQAQMSYACRQRITAKGILAPFGTNDPIARVGRRVEPDASDLGQAELDWGLPSESLDRLGLGSLEQYQPALSWPTPTPDDKEESEQPDFGFPEF